MFEDLVRKAKGFLSHRQQAYQQTFSNGKFSEEVLKDLAKFCRATETTFHDDPRKHAVAEGRREVWLRITSHLHLDPETLWQKYGRKDLE